MEFFIELAVAFLDLVLFRKKKAKDQNANGDTDQKLNEENLKTHKRGKK